MRIAMVTNIPAPYRLPVYEKLAAEPGVELCVFFFSGREPDRAWELPSGGFQQVFLRENFIRFRERFIHFNPDLWSQLKTYRPDIVITTGFNPSHLIAFAYAVFHRVRHIAMTDGTLVSEQKLSYAHRLVRQIVYRRSAAFLGASDGAAALYRSHGVRPERVYKSFLCADNAAFARLGPIEKRYDFIFCGRFVAVKNPLFAIEVASATARQLGRKVSMLFVGSGELLSVMQNAVHVNPEFIDATFAGFATQEELPALYSAARLFLFPTQWDPWGVVANEACAAGLPILVSPVAGSASELIVDQDNGYVLPLDLAQWTAAAVRLLTDAQLYARMSARSRERVAPYTYDQAADGILQAARATLTPPLREVVIVQRRMTNYRIPLFDMMREKLRRDGIVLTVVFGDPTWDEVQKKDGAQLAWGIHVPCTYWFDGRLCWQNVRPHTHSAELVVVTQENKLLFNYVFAITPGKKVAYWGHGKNFQAKRSNMLRERIKRWWTTRADWWFAYTELSARVIIDEAKFPSEKVTVLNNSIDTTLLERDLGGVSAADVTAARLRFQIGQGPVGIMIASLHADKQIAFLLEAAGRIRLRIPDFELVIVGDGPEREKVRHAAAAQEWMHWLGVRGGIEKAALLKMALVMLNPGMVGLGILDSFVAGLPMVTSMVGQHSPEIAYFEPGINGLISTSDVDDYVDCVVAVLTDANLHERLRAGCLASAGAVSLEKMADRFCDGIRGALAMDKAALVAA